MTTKDSLTGSRKPKGGYWRESPQVVLWSEGVELGAEVSEGQHESIMD